MEFELKDIKEIRKKFSLTQSQLAKKSNVSQSLIAKIEAGRLDPTYSNAKKIFSALALLVAEKETKVSEIMQTKIISILPESEIGEAVQKMRKYGISQMPVIEKDKPLGLLSEAVVLDALMSGKKDAKAKEIMLDAPPTITKDASISVASDLLKVYPMVMVAEKGMLLGIVTKSDIMASFAPKKRYGLF